MTEPKPGKYLRRSLKFLLWAFAGIVGLIVLIVVALQFPGIQRYVVHRAISSLTEKTNTRIEIGSVNIAFTHSVVLHDVFVESRERDTLLYIQTLAVDVNLLGLFSRTIRLNNVRIDSLTANVNRTLPDSSFNFDFILRALNSSSSASSIRPDTSPGATWKVTLGGLELHAVRAQYVDRVTGLSAHILLGHLKASIDKFDLDKNQFHIDDLSIENTVADVIETKESTAGESDGVLPDIGLGSASLINLQFQYENRLSGERYEATLGNANVVAEQVDLPSHRIVIKTFKLAKTNILIVGRHKEEEPSRPAAESTSKPWVISVGQLVFRDNNAQYDLENTARIKGFDPNHLLVSDLALDAKNAYFSENRLGADFDHVSLRERSGLNILKLSGKVAIDSVHAMLENFALETPTSRIRQTIAFSYPSFSVLKRTPGEVTVNATISESKIGIPDLLLFEPSLPVKNRPEANISTSMVLSGLVKDLRIEELSLAAGESTYVDLSGTIRGLPDVNTAIYDINLHRISSGRGDFQSFTGDSLLPKGITLPASITLTGHFEGTISDFTASSDIVTSIGSANVNASLISANRANTKSAQWKTDIDVQRLNVGLLLRDTSTFGSVSLKASATGTGFNKDDIEAQLNVQVEEAVLNGYPYRGLSVEGTASHKMFEGKAAIQDSNIAFVFNGIVNTNEENPTYKFMLNLKGADLQRLNLASDDMRVAGVITSDLTGRSINDMNGNVDVRNVVVIKNHKRYTIDSLMYASVNNDKVTHISVQSAIFTAQFDGTIALGDLPAALKDHFSRYFTLHDKARETKTKPQAFTFKVLLHNPGILTEVFLPQLSGLDAGVMEGNYDSEKKILNVNTAIATFTYNDIRIDSLTLKVTSDVDRLQSTLRVGSVSDSMLHVTNLQLTAAMARDSLDLSLQSTGHDGTTKMLLAGIFNSVQKGYQFRFKQDGVVFQNNKWSVPSDHYLLFGDHQFIAHNVVLHGDGQSLSIGSMEQKDQIPPLKIEFLNFDLRTLSRVIERDSGFVGGVLNGNVVLRNLDKQMAFTSDLKIGHFRFAQRLVGDIAMRATNQTPNVYEVNMDITRDDNAISVHGSYMSKEGGSELDLTLDLRNVNLASLEPFTFGEVRRLSGTMNGKLHLSGTLKTPSITGNLKFVNTAFDPVFLNSYLHLNAGEIAFDGKGIRVESFDLVDTLGNTASLKGNLSTEDFRDFTYDVRLHTEHFLLMNKPASRDALYYGTVYLSSDIVVQGDQSKPVIRLQAKLDKGTDLAVVVPESGTAVQQRGGIVEFVDVKNPPNSIMSRSTSGTEQVSDTTRTRLSSLDLTSNVEVDKESKLRILIDPIAGDSLVIRGEASFSVGIDPSGKLAVTGRYEIFDGTYQFSFGSLVKKEFTIEKGSSITWLGSVTDANVDITAMYTVKTSALDLVQDQLVGLSQEERTKYKQELHIQVYLVMGGRLLEPNIHFKLDLPPDERSALGGSIYAKINELNGEESELNKQAFALLVLGRFVSTNPLASLGEGGFSDYARSSVSQILTEQLGRLSEKYIHGASLNVGVQSYQDYSSGTAEGRTQLQLALSKQFFDERVTVQVGGNVDLEGQRSQQNSLNNFAGDMKVSYKLTEDGRWQMQVFRQNIYEGAIEGDLVNTGVGLVFTIEYDKLFGFTLKPVPDNKGEKKQ